MLAALARLRVGPGDELIVADNTPDGVVAGGRPGPGCARAAAALRLSRAQRRRGRRDRRVAAVHGRRLRTARRPPRPALGSRARAGLRRGRRRGPRGRGADGAARPLGAVAAWGDRLAPPRARVAAGRDDGEPARATRRVRGRRRVLRGAVGRGHRALLAARRARPAPRAPARGRRGAPRPGAPRRRCPAGRRLRRRPALAAPASFGDEVPGMPLARPLGRALGGALAWTLALRFERAAFKLADGVAGAAGWWGYTFGDNLPAQRPTAWGCGCARPRGRPRRPRPGRAGRSRGRAAARRPRPPRGPRCRAGRDRRARRAARASG